MNCIHKRKVAWGNRVACLDCGAILLCEEKDTPAKATRNPVLSDKGKLVMELRAMNWTYNDIAKQIGKSVGVVKMLETTAKKVLRMEGR